MRAEENKMPKKDYATLPKEWASNVNKAMSGIA
jgi:hypothetical protein